MSKPVFQIQIYQGRRMLRQAWRWRAIAANNRVIATGGEAYTNKADVIGVVQLLFGTTVSIHIQGEDI